MEFNALLHLVYNISKVRRADVDGDKDNVYDDDIDDNDVKDITDNVDDGVGDEDGVLSCS